MFMNFLWDRARQQNLIHTDREIMGQVMAFQQGLEQVENYANVSIPIVYEVVSLEFRYSHDFLGVTWIFILR